MFPRGNTSSPDRCPISLGEAQELWLGPGPRGSLFDSREALVSAWQRARGYVMRLWGRGGKRPMAWWQFEAPDLGLKWPGYDRQQSYLFAAGVLEEKERAELELQWRRDFEHARSIEDPVARKRYLDWADVPISLRQEWRAERRRPKRQSAPSAEAGA